MIKCHRSTFSRKLHYKEHDKSLDTIGKRTIHCAKENKSRLWSNLSSNAEMILLSMTGLQCLITFLYFYSTFDSKWIEYRKQHVWVVSSVHQWKDLSPLCRISNTIAQSQIVWWLKLHNNSSYEYIHIIYVLHVSAKSDKWKNSRNSLLHLHSFLLLLWLMNGYFETFSLRKAVFALYISLIHSVTALAFDIKCTY